jgi:hypothetical protein
MSLSSTLSFVNKSIRNSRIGSVRHVDVPWQTDVRVEVHYDDSKSLPMCTEPKISQYEVTGITSAYSDYKVNAALHFDILCLEHFFSNMVMHKFSLHLS